jgi:hypothetical protein
MSIFLNAIAREFDRRDTARSNSSRDAEVVLTVRTQGTGRFRHPQMLALPVPFIDEPSVSEGSAVIVNPNPDAWWDQEGRIGVYGWSRNPSGLVVGVFVWTSVVMEARIEDPPEVSARVKTQHFLTLRGPAIKDFGPAAWAQAEQLSPRTTGA